MKRIVLVLALALVWQINAQRDEAYVDKLISEFTLKLEERSISSWFAVKRYCTGTVEIFRLADGSLCSSKGTYFETYLFWVEDDGSPKIKKLDNCGMYYTLPIDDNRITDFVKSNMNNLTSNSVKNYEANNITGSPQLSTSIHSCKRTYIFGKDDGVVNSSFNLFDLSTSNKHPNIHYEYNNGLKLVELDQMVDEIIAPLQRKFRRQKQ